MKWLRTICETEETMVACKHFRPCSIKIIGKNKMAMAQGKQDITGFRRSQFS